MNQNLLSTLVSNLVNDLQNPGLLWQIAALVVSLVAGWTLASVLKGKLTARDAQLRVMRFGVESFSRVLSPLVGLAFVIVSKLMLEQWYQVALLRIAIPVVGSFALVRLVFYVLRRVFVRGGKAGGFLLLFEKGFATLVWSGFALYITGLWPELIQYLDNTVLPIGRHKASLLMILQAAASVIFTLMIALWAGALLEERLMRMDSVHSSLRAVMARMTRAILILVAVLVSLSLVGIDLTVLSVFGGALGVGLGLGLQKIASSYVSGFVILLERSLAVGDMVTVDKFSGQVTKINTRYTIIRSMDGIETVMPNEMLVSSPVQNYSLTDRTLRLTTRVTVGYQSDIEMLLPVLQETTAGITRVLQDPAPQALLVRFDPSGFEVEIGLWIADPENGRLNIVSEVNRAIWKTLKKHNVEVPYPQREVRLVDVPSSVETKVAHIIRATETT